MNPTFLEVFTVLASFVGTILSARAMVDADLTVRAVEEMRLNGVRMAIAERHRMIQRGLFLIHLVVFFVALPALWWDQAPALRGLDAPTRAVWRDVVYAVMAYRFGLAVVSTTLLAVSYRSWIALIPLMEIRDSDDG